MSSAASPVKLGKRLHSVWSTLILLILIFLYFYFRIDPKLIFQSQQPFFYFEKYFIVGFFNRPGGVNELAAAFPGQFLYFSWTGALLIVALIWAFVWNTRLLLQHVRPDFTIHYFHWLPAVFLLAAHSDYKFLLMFSLGLLWVLIATNIFLYFAPGQSWLRLFFFALMTSLLYIVVGGVFWIFVIIAILNDLIVKRRFIPSLVYLLFAAAIPWFGATFLYLIHLPDAYTANMFSSALYKSGPFLNGLYLFFPLAFLLSVLFRKKSFTSQKGAGKGLSRFIMGDSKWARMIHGLVLLALFVIFAQSSFEKNKKNFYEIDYYARFEQWGKVLERIQKLDQNPYRVLFQANRALFHRGLLADKMFALPQVAGVDGLFMNDQFYNFYLEQHADLFYDLGIVNEAEHWTYEDMEMTGETAWNLRRLVQVNFLKNDPKVADKYLKKLEKSIWDKKWARKYRDYLAKSDSFVVPPELMKVKQKMPVTDFLIPISAPELCLDDLMLNKNNKMAFEYFMMYCLLDGKLTDFFRNLPKLKQFNYPNIPRHFEEAILIFLQLTGRKGFVLPGYQIRQETIQRFVDFNQILTRHRKDKMQALPEVEQKYSDTYWFYALYYFKPRES